MIKIGVNKYQFIGKIVVLLLIFCVSLLICFKPIKDINQQIPALLFMVAIGIGILYMFVLIALELFFLPIGVEIDEHAKSLTINYFILKPSTFKVIEIAASYWIRLYTKSSSHEGLLIELKNSKTILVSDFNLSNYTPVKVFLEREEIVSSVDKKINMISYFINMFKNREQD